MLKAMDGILAAAGPLCAVVPVGGASFGLTTKNKVLLHKMRKMRPLNASRRTRYVICTVLGARWSSPAKQSALSQNPLFCTHEIAVCGCVAFKIYICRSKSLTGTIFDSSDKFFGLRPELVQRKRLGSITNESSFALCALD